MGKPIAKDYQPQGPWVVLPDTNEVVSYFDQYGNVEVAIQDQFSQAVAIPFGLTAAQTTLANDAVINTYTIDVTDSTGFIVGDSLFIFSGTLGQRQFYAGRILAVNANIISLSVPINYVYVAGDPVGARKNNMGVDGSVTPLAFTIPIGTGGRALDITRVMFYMICDSEPDNSLFGDLPALTMGVVLRKYESATEYFNVFTFPNNGAFILAGNNLEYTDKGGAGTYGVKSMIQFNGRQNYGVVIRLNPGQYLELLIQDDLTDLLGFYASINGHIVE